MEAEVLLLLKPLLIITWNTYALDSYTDAKDTVSLLSASAERLILLYVSGQVEEFLLLRC